MKEPVPARLFTRPKAYTTEGLVAEEKLAPVSIIAAVLFPSRGIGYMNNLPWKGVLKLDLEYFERLTTYTNESDHTVNAVVMGRRTWMSLPCKCRPLPRRLNAIISSTMTLNETENISVPAVLNIDKPLIFTSVEDAVDRIRHQYVDSVNHIFVIGGEAIYARALNLNILSRLYITRVIGDLPCDVFFPSISTDKFSMVAVSTTYSSSCKSLPFDFVIYDRNNGSTDVYGSLTFSECNRTIDWLQNVFSFKSPMSIIQNDNVCFRMHEEYQYLDCIQKILQEGEKFCDRTGVGIVSMFGIMMKYNLRESFPLLTTKKVFWKGVVEELLWFMRGSTNGNELLKVNVKIWQKHASREYFDSLGFFDREVGDLGPIYGFQWRHFGAIYKTMNDNYDGQGIDQLLECINTIKSDPHSRRICMCAWNPCDLKKMALPPCHLLAQFHVAGDELSCLMFQRSADMGLGVPFNIASYSLLTCIVAQLCGLKPGTFTHCIGNGHIYLNHIESLKHQLTRTPKPFPILLIKNPSANNIEDFKSTDFVIVGYKPHDKISMEMAV